MRMLGSAARSVGTLVGAEQLTICLLGVALGLLFGWLRYGSLAGEILVAEGLYISGSLFGILAGGVAIAGRNPLVLLQEKE